MDELKSRLERHKFHIQKLEALLRMLVNESVEVKQVPKLLLFNLFYGNLFIFLILD